MHIPHIVRSFIKRLGLYEGIAFASGFILMAYELAASRILAPTIGTSIYVWTSVIGVMIAALAVGYAAGGWVADKRGVAQDIAWLLIAAALGVTITCIFSDAVLTAVTMIAGDVRIQGVIASAILFAPASFTMGMISPYLAKIRVSSLKSTGRSVAALSALNSLGGITGTFSAGFIFFNYIGSRETLALLAVLLLACSWLILSHHHRRDRIIISIVVCGTLALQLASPVHAGTVAEIDTPTSHYRIADVTQDWRELRVLIMGPGGYQSGVYTSGPKDLAFSYTRKLADVVHAKPDKARILILGGGAFTLPEYIAKEYTDIEIDVVEIDTELPEIAKQYFRYEPTANIHVIAEDARTYLKNTDKRYDVVVMDAYNDDTVPFSLATREYAASLKKVVQPDGVMAVNIIASASKDCMPLLSSVNSTYRSVFGNARIYPLVDPANRIKQNIIAIYSNDSLLWANHLIGENTDTLPAGQKLTDNFAPTERLIQQCK